MDDVYELLRRGTELLEAGHNHQATIPLARARDLAPDKTSIREALGRALFRAQRYEQAAEEFQAVIDRAPTNDYALFCLGRSCSCSAATPRRASRWRRRLHAARPARLPHRRDRARARAGTGNRGEPTPPSRRADLRESGREPDSLPSRAEPDPRSEGRAKRLTPCAHRAMQSRRAV